MNNIYDTANQLEREFRQLPAYAKLKESLEAIMSDEESAALYKEFREKAQQFQELMMSGQALTEEQQTDFESVSERVGQNEAIQNLINNEHQVNQVLMDINNILTRPLNEIYQPSQADTSSQPVE